MTNIDWSKAPEGATHYRAGVESPWHNSDSKSFYSESIKCWMPYGRHDHFENAMLYAIPRPTEQPQWSGEGLPPIGTEVEYYSAAHDGEWFKGKVLGYHDKYVWMLESHDNEPCTYSISELQFRPIKSERDQQIDALLSVIQSLPFFSNSRDIVAEMYDKGVRVEI